MVEKEDIKYGIFDNLEDLDEEEKYKKESDIIENKSEYNLNQFNDEFNSNRNNDISLNFLKNANIDDIFIFPFRDDLILLIQRNWEFIEERGKLVWYEVDGFKKKEIEEQMIHQISNNEYIHTLCKVYIKTDFKLYRIPIYFIPIVRETYIRKRYGENSGEWEIHIHSFIEYNLNKLDFEITPKFKLFDYQNNAVREWHYNRDFGTVSLATGGGKTIIAIQILINSGLSTLIVVPTIPLVKQWKEELLKLTDIKEKDIGLFYSDKKQFRPIMISTYDSLQIYIDFDEEQRQEILSNSDLSHEEKNKKIQKRENISNYLKNYYSLLILDESHHIPAPKFKRIALTSKALKRLSLTATAERFDGNESLLFFSCGSKIFEMGYTQLCEKGRVCPFIYQYVPVQLPLSVLEDYVKHGKNIEQKKRMTFFNESKLYDITKIVQNHMMQKHKIIIFVTYVDTAYRIYDELNYLGHKCDLVLSNKNQKRKSKLNRNDVISQFQNNKLDIIISTSVLDEGFNVPDCNVAIIVSSPSSQPRPLIQRIGRIIRATNNTKIAYVYELTSEGNDEIHTIDELSRLNRNGMIEDSAEFKKDKLINTSKFWTYDYEKINKFTENFAKKNNIILLKIYNSKRFY